MVKTGEMAPAFTLTADDGTQVSLSDFRGKKVALYFYPKADTPGCTRQACAIRDVYPDIEPLLLKRILTGWSLLSWEFEQWIKNQTSILIQQRNLIFL